MAIEGPSPMTSDQTPDVHLQTQRCVRDLHPSHVYRLGVGLFKSQPVRRRVIESSLFSPVQRSPHSELLRRTLDGKEEKASHPGPLVSPETLFPPSLPQALRGSEANAFTEDDYHTWMESRRSMRAGLEGAGLTERWLRGKDRTELEARVLARLSGSTESSQLVTESMAESKPVDQKIVQATPPNRPSPKAHEEVRRHKPRNALLREIELAAGRLFCVRQRLVSLLMRADADLDGCVTGAELAAILERVGVALSLECLHTLTQALLCGEREGEGRGEKGEVKVDYRKMVAAISSRQAPSSEDIEKKDKGGLISLLQEYLDRQGSAVNSPNISSLGSDAVLSDEQVCINREASLTMSTMDGPHGKLVVECKQDQMKQFAALLEYCKSIGVVLNRELVERALLWPLDCTMSQCKDCMRQPGLDLLSAHFADPPVEEVPQETKCPREEFGGAYKELRPRSRAKRPTLLSTGRAKVDPKVDCWLTYEEFLHLTMNIRSRPGFKYKYHGPPKKGAFWPGTLLDKLRLCLTPEDGSCAAASGPCSVHNIFQPVDHSRVYNRTAPVLGQVMSWPSNCNGYVQFGGQNRKQYAI